MYKKVLFAVKTFNRLHYLHDCLSSFLLTRDSQISWTLVVADDGSSDGTITYLENISARIPVYLIRNSRRYAVGQANTILDFFHQGDFDYGICVDDDVFFKSPGWASAYMHATQRSGFSHLCYYDKAFAIRAGKSHRSATIDVKGASLTSYGSAHDCMGCFFTFDRELVEVVGYADEDNFPIHGQWHVDYSLRACRAGFNNIENFYDVSGSERWIGLQDHFSYHYRAAEKRVHGAGKLKSALEVGRRSEILRTPDRIHLAKPKKTYVSERIC